MSLHQYATRIARALVPIASLCALSACGANPDPSDRPLSNGGSGAFGPSSSGGSVAPGSGLTGSTAGTSAISSGTTAGTTGTSGPTVAGSAGTSAAVSGSGGAAAPGGDTLPCDVSKALATNCQSCHGATPIGGAPMSLVSYADLHAPAKTMPSIQVYQMAKMRLENTAKPMPPGGMIAAADKSTLDAYFTSGATPGGASDASCATGGAMPVTGTSTSDGSYGALTPAPGETCYEFTNHNGSTTDDKTAYQDGTGEHYEQFYFKAPWPSGSQATRYGTKLDNSKVLHHWLLFSTTETDAAGTHKTSPLPTLIGVNAQLLAGWAVGGSNLAMPDDVGFELPDNGTELNVQWHFYNSTGSTQTDASSVQVCTVPMGTRPHTATITWLGQENLGGNKWFGGAGMPPHQMSKYSGTCNPLRTGMNSTDPVHIIAFWPHMHTLGIEMTSVVNHKDGTMETVFDKPFDFNHQVHYMQNYDLAAGDTITSTCTFNNTTDKGVPFGEDTGNEMCYQFTFAWPAHSLENHASSLIGATNTCW